MHKSTLLVLIFYCLSSCSESDHKPPEENLRFSVIQNPKKTQSQKDKDYYESYHVENGDTVTFGGKFVRFRMDSSHQVIMTWGKSDFQRSENIGEPFGSYNPPWFICEWKNFIGLKSGCGTECSMLTVLPMNNSDSIRKFPHPILIDSIRNLVFHIESKGDQIYKVVNIENRKEKILGMTLNYSGYYGDVIDSVCFVPNGLFLRWQDSNYVEQEKVFEFRFD